MGNSTMAGLKTLNPSHYVCVKERDGLRFTKPGPHTCTSLLSAITLIVMMAFKAWSSTATRALLIVVSLYQIKYILYKSVQTFYNNKP